MGGMGGDGNFGDRCKIDGVSTSCKPFFATVTTRFLTVTNALFECHKPKKTVTTALFDCHNCPFLLVFYVFVD